MKKSITAAPSSNQTHFSPIPAKKAKTEPAAAWQGRKVEKIDRTASVEGNVFDPVPPEVMIDDLAPYFSPRELWFLRHVNKRFSELFNDPSIWKVFYNAHGLKPETQSDNSLLYKATNKLPVWICLKKTLDEAVLSLVRKRQNNQEHIHDECHPNAFCIAILTMPELSPLHDHAMHILTTVGRFPKTHSLNDLMIKVAAGQNGFETLDHARKLAIRFISKKIDETAVQQALLSILVIDPASTIHNTNVLRREAIAALVPFLSKPESFTDEIQNLLLSVLQKDGLDGIKPAFDVLITKPIFFNAIVDKITDSFVDCIHKYLSNENVVELLLDRLSKEQRLYVLIRLIHALKPIGNQKRVQEAVYQKKPVFLEMLPVLKNPQAAVRLLGYLAPFELINSIVHPAILNSKNESDLNSIPLDLPADVHRDEVCANLIHVISNKKLYTKEQRVNAINALRPIANKPSIVRNFRALLQFDTDLTIQSALIDALAPHLSSEKVLKLFLQIARGFIAANMQESVIKKLGPMANKPEVSSVLLEVFEKSHAGVKAACIRALCWDPAAPLIGPGKLFACFYESAAVTEEVTRVLKMWLRD